MGERGELLWTKGSELKATFGCLKPGGHVVSLRPNWSWWQLKVKAAFLYQELQQPAQRVNNHLFTTAFLSPLLFRIILSWQPLFLVDWLEKTKKHFALSPTQPPLDSIAPSSCSPPTPPFFVNFMDLSANGLPPHRPSHIWHLQPGPSRPLSFNVAPPLAPSGRSEPAAGGGREKANRLVLFTLLARVLLSSTMISVSIASARHLLDSTAVSVFFGWHHCRTVVRIEEIKILTWWWC